MLTRIPITKARINLGAVVKRAHLNGEYFLLEKDGIPIAGIMDAEEFQDYLDRKNPEVKKSIAQSRADQTAGRVRPLSAFIQELARERQSKKSRAKHQ